MSIARFAPLLLLAVPAALAAQSMPVATFLAKANVLERKGPLAMFSGDLKLLLGQVKGDFAQIRQERLSAKAGGKPAPFCPPDVGVKLSNRDIMAAMQAVPQPDRARTDTRAALRAMLIRRYPCPKT